MFSSQYELYKEVAKSSRESHEPLNVSSQAQDESAVHRAALSYSAHKAFCDVSFERNESPSKVVSVLSSVTSNLHVLSAAVHVQPILTSLHVLSPPKVAKPHVNEGTSKSKKEPNSIPNRTLSASSFVHESVGQVFQVHCTNASQATWVVPVALHNCCSLITTHMLECVAIVAAAFDSRLLLFFFEALVVVVAADDDDDEAMTRSTSSFACFSALAYSSVPSHLFKEKGAAVDDFWASMSLLLPRRRNFETRTDDASTPPKREEGKAENERIATRRRKLEKKSFVEVVVIVYRFEGGG